MTPKKTETSTKEVLDIASGAEELGTASDAAISPLKEVVDILREADDLGPTSDAAITPLEEWDKEQGISVKWFKERTVIFISAIVILSLLAAGLTVLAKSSDKETRNWAFQILSTLMGFAAGAIWQSQANNRN